MQRYRIYVTGPVTKYLRLMIWIPQRDCRKMQAMFRAAMNLEMADSWLLYQIITVQKNG